VIDYPYGVRVTGSEHIPDGFIGLMGTAEKDLTDGLIQVRLDRLSMDRSWCIPLRRNEFEPLAPQE
jgi:hypothetical protein